MPAHEVEDLEVCAAAGKAPRLHGPYLIRIGDAGLSFRKARIEDPVPTGRQVLQVAGAHPVEEHMVFQILRNRELEELRLDETTDLRAAKAECFLVFKGATSFRLELDSRVLEWGAPTITGRTLKYLARVNPQGHQVWLELRGKGDQLIEDDESVRLDGEGLERFFTASCQTTRDGSIDHDGTDTEDRQDAPSEITIFVNEKPVKLMGEQHTGAEIKQAAIEAGVEIDPDFVLKLECGPDQTEVIPNLRPIEIRCGTRIQAIADDDNS